MKKNSVFYSLALIVALLSNLIFQVTPAYAASPSDKAITDYSIPGQVGLTTINEVSGTISVHVPHATNVTALVASFTHNGASIRIGATAQVSGVTANNFTSPRTYTVTAADSSTKNYVVTVTIDPDTTAKDITAFSFVSPAATGSIVGTNISLHVPFGTSVSALVASFTTTGASVKVGATTQTSGVTTNDFTSPVTYTVTALDASTKDYTVTVTVDPLSSTKAITSFSLPSQVGPADINEASHTIGVTVLYATNVTALAASFTHNGASIAIGGTPQVSGVTTNDFTSPVTYTVTAADASTQNYLVTVTVAAPSTTKALTAFTVPGQVGLTSINEAAHTVAISVPFGTNVTALVASFSHTGVSVKVGATTQTSGVTANNFTSPVTYTVTAQDASTQDYTVTITPIVNKDITAFSFASPAATGSIVGTNIAVTVPFGTNVSALVASFTHNGASVNIGGTPQTSGVTANDFSGPVTYTVVGADASTKNYIVTVTIAPSPAKAITAYSIPGQVGLTTINEVSGAISVHMPYATNVTALVASFTHTGASIRIGATAQVSGVTANNFTSPRIYVVTAADSTTKNYVVTVTIDPDTTAKDITAFSFVSPAATGSIVGTNISLHVPFGTSVSALVASFTTTGASVKVGATTQTSGVTANDFTSPVTYTVTALDASTKDYTVTVTVDPLSSTKAITSFSLPSQVGPADINEASHTIGVTVLYATNVTALAASFTHNGASIAVGATPQVSGVTTNDFTSPVTYTVTAADASTQNYLVTVTVAAPSTTKALTAFTVPGQVGLTSINEGAHTVAISVPFGTNVTALVASFSHTGVSVKIGATTQTSGVTANNFTSPVTYTVTAQDASTQDYTVTITPIVNKDITAFSFASPAATGSIVGTNIAVIVPFGTNVSALVASFTHNGASVNIGGTPQTSGVTANDFSSPVTYTVVGADASTKNYIVTVTIAPSPAKAITDYSIPGQVGLTTINEVSGTISVHVPYATNVTALVASFTHTGASIRIGATAQVSGVTANNFTSPRTYTVTAADSTTKNYVVTVTIDPSTAPKDITAFGFVSPAVDGVINGTNIAVTVPYGTNVTALVATFTTTGASVKVGATTQTSGVTANNFTSPVTYTVTASDSSTKSYVVTVTVAANPSKDITAFGFVSPAVDGVITGTDIAVTVPFGTNVSALVATFTTSGASVKVGGTLQTSGVTANDFTSPVTYIVTAADATTKAYTVTVTIAPSTSKDITAFGFVSPAVDGVITGTDIAVTVPFGTNVTNLVATFATTGESVAIGGTPQTSGVTANDFTSPVTYTVTAANSTTKNYIVTVTVAANTAKAITAFTIPGQVGSTSIVEASGAITVHVPYLTNVTALVPTVAITGESVSPASGVAQNFTSPVTYTVTAADLSTKDYVVTVVIDAQAATPTITASGAGTVLPNSQYTYTFTYTTDANVSGTQVGFSLPSHTTYVSDSGAFCGESSGIVTCNVGDITTAGGSFTVTVAVDKLKKIGSNLTLNASAYSISAIGVPVINGTATVSASTLTLFADVASGYWALDQIQAVWAGGITSGCTTVPLAYCPSTIVTRAQMAIFLVRAMHGVAFTPPTATGAFSDVPVGSFGADYIEQLASDGITGGCGGGKFCPNTTVTRAQMAVFLVRATHGSSFTPPIATGMFSDVPVGSFGADFIEQLANDNITGGCGGTNFCPNTTVTRAQMAVFLQKAFPGSLPLPTP